MRSAIVRIDESRVEVELIDLVKFRPEDLGWHFRYPQANNLYAMGPNQTPGSHRGSLTINGSGLTSWSRRSYAVFRAAKGTAVATYIP
jgi:hypothetical protein